MASAKKNPKSTKPAKRRVIDFGPVIADDRGVIYSEQSAAGRSNRASVIIRCESLDDPGQIIHTHSTRSDALWCSPAGHVYAASRDGRVHTNASGAWKQTRLGLVGVRHLWGVDDEFVIVTGDRGALMLAGTSWQSVDTGIDGWLLSVSGTGRDDVYVACQGSTLLHYDGTAWTRLAIPDIRPDTGLTVYCRSREEVFITGELAGGLFCGNRRRGFLRVADGDARTFGGDHAGVLHVGAYGTGLATFDGKALRPVERDGSLDVDYVHASKHYVLASCLYYPALVTFDGTSWRDKTFAT